MLYRCQPLTNLLARRQRISAKGALLQFRNIDLDAIAHDDIAGLLTGLYAVLYVLLSLEAYSLLIGAVLLFVALAGIMYLTRNLDWSGLGRRGD